MSDNENDNFKPRLGRIGNAGKKSSKRFIDRVLNAAGKIDNNFVKSGYHRSFTGRNMGRGYMVVSSTRNQFRSTANQRRVVIKSRIVKLAQNGFSKATSHLKYIQRDGVDKNGEAGKIYDAEYDEVDGKSFLEDSRDDRHQFRFIVSPEDAIELEDLKEYTRDLMNHMEHDLGTKLDWVAVDHYNTDNPHTHIIVRGVDEDGKDLIIARDYMSSGLRERATDLATDELGPRYEHKIAMAMRNEVNKNRFTSVDRKLIANADFGQVDMRGQVSKGYQKLNHSLQIARLEKLENMQLARKVSPGIWQLSEDMEPTLRELGTRGDIIKTIHAEMTLSGKPEINVNYEIFNAQDQKDKKVIGQIVGKGFSNESEDSYYLVVEGIDGKTHYADLKQNDDVQDYHRGSIVELVPRNTEPQKSDRNISRIAYANGGIYSAEIHEGEGTGNSESYIQSHVRRLEALRRANIVRRFNDGSFEIPDDYLEKVENHNIIQAQKSPLNVITRSEFSLDVQVTSSGATWLDRNLIAKEKPFISNTGFGAETEAALKRRQAYLIKAGFAEETEQGTEYQRGMLNKLEQQEISKVTAKLSTELGKRYVPASKGDRVEGIYTKSVELASGRFAIVEQSKEFNLVPWRSVLERSRNQLVSGKVGGTGINWQIGKKRGLGIS
ncbi:MAG: relaxase/mobilization nuclease and DUF3363 domain-containing protein [OCS116 cluster bacterium]|nr:relaxase/mobilization nuclease and DUF3363 domain-containing protein [OCS116 cluster bacterium]